jgi:hypothetical protein
MHIARRVAGVRTAALSHFISAMRHTGRLTMMFAVGTGARFDTEVPRFAVTIAWVGITSCRPTQ